MALPYERRREAANEIERRLLGGAPGANAAGPPIEEGKLTKIPGIIEEVGPPGMPTPDVVEQLEALIVQWQPKSKEGKRYEKDLQKVVDSLKSLERDVQPEWGSKKGEYKRRDVGGVEKKAGDVGGHYKAYE